MGKYFQQALVDCFIADDSVNVDYLGLPHSMRAGNRLVFNRRLDLNFGDNNHRRLLDIKPHATGTDLRQ